MNRPPKTEPKTVGALLAGSSLSRRPGAVDRSLWALAVGERIAARAEPVGLRQDVLLVRVVSSVWAQELSLLSASIVEQLRQHGVHVSGLRFVVGDVNPTQAPGRVLKPKRSRPLPTELQKRLERIDDPELRRAIEEAASWAGPSDESE